MNIEQRALRALVLIDDIKSIVESSTGNRDSISNVEIMNTIRESKNLSKLKKTIIKKSERIMSDNLGRNKFSFILKRAQ